MSETESTAEEVRESTLRVLTELNGLPAWKAISALASASAVLLAHGRNDHADYSAYRGDVETFIHRLRSMCVGEWSRITGEDVDLGERSTEPENLAESNVLELRGYRVAPWCPLPDGQGPATEVHFVLDLENGGSTLAMALRLKTQRAVDSLVALLTQHGAEVFGGGRS